MVRRISSSIFVGRTSERAQLEAALDAAMRSEPGLVLIGGEAGIGKTRLTAELADVAVARGGLAVSGHCLDAKAVSMPYGPFVEILRGLLLPVPPDRHAAPVEPGRAALARLVPEIGPRPAFEIRPLSEGERLRLFHAVLELLGLTGKDRPLLLVVEDVHWADASSLDLLGFITRELGTERLLILCTFRTDELHRRHPLLPVLGELVRLPGVMRVDLPAFSEPEVADQLTGITEGPLSDDVIQRIFARSDGNPFFVEELAGHPAGAQLPTTLHDVLAGRLASLSPNGRAVVVTAAAIGREATQELIAQVAALEKEELLGALREAVDHHVLVPGDPRRPPGFAFRHALIQEQAYTELLPSERIALHLAILTSLQDAGGSPGEIARHAFLGHDLPTSLVASVDAADQAIEALAFAEALAHLERALELWSAVGAPESVARRDQASLLRLAGRCAAALGQWRRAADFDRMALAHLDPTERRDERTRVLIDLANWERFADDWAAHAAALREAAELVTTDPPSALRARVLTDLAHDADLNGRWDEARRLAKEAIDVSRAIGAPEEEARALVRLAEVLLSTLRPVDADRVLTQAERIVVDMDTAPEDLIGHLVFRQADSALQAGDFGRAIAIADAGLARAARAGTFGRNAGFLRAIKITALADLGRWHEAETLAEEARRRDPAAMTARMAVESFVPVLVRQGKVAEATAAVRATDPGTVTMPTGGAFTLEARIRVAYGEGRWDDARAAADEMVRLLDGPDVSLLDLCVGGEADRAEFARGRRRTAEEAEARRVGLARLVLGQAAVQEAIDQGGAGPAIEAILAMAEAEGSRLLDRPDVKRWEDVARRREALAQPWETAYARFRQAEAILATGGPKDQALLVLRGAHDIASQLRASPLLDQIERLARRSRMRLTPAEAGGRQPLARTPEGVSVVLTAREREVLTLVAAGHTNREIGRDLFISEKTASVHVSNAMDKLGALSRYDAAASATRLGLLDAASRGSVTR